MFFRILLWCVAIASLQSSRLCTRALYAQNTPQNVLLIVADDLKASVLGCYGDQVCQTPHLDRLASQGTVFERAYCQGTWCAPSRTSFMHSRYTDRKNLTLGEQLQQHGATATRVGKIFHMRVPGDIIAGTDGADVIDCWTQRFNAPGPEAHTPGEYACLNLNVVTDSMFNRQSTKMPHRMFVSVKSTTDGTEQADFKAATKAIEIIGQPKDQPFFLAVGLVRPHYPMVAPSEYFSDYGIDRIEMPGNWHDDTSDIPQPGLAGTRNDQNPIGKYPDNQKRMWSAYYASVSFMDTQVGRILDALESSPHAKDTAVMFISDHGYHLGEHGFWQKSNLHEEVIRVPFLVRVPGQSPAHSQSFVELVDLYPTVCDLMGVPIPEATEGSSLLQIVNDPEYQIRDDALSIHKGGSLRTSRWHYIRYANGSEELYDMQGDPDEITNLAGNVELVDVQQELAARLKQRLPK
ncbi:sulfatase [Stieleria sp. JC731]|uniref:sulfatase n=1 Tax=Pirellulaceae TaxID=2691357 RepID=UPI001E570498|nr:sulfatase [Stieleria sp. JC731]MCC9599123.1 sulfatase [Stieleria sp. JC731]